MSGEVLTYQEWSSFIFSKKVADDPASWIYLDKFMQPKLDKSTLCKFIGLTFESAEALRSLYDLPQLAYGLNFILNPYVSDFSYSLLEPNVDEALKLKSIKSMMIIYKEIFNPYCCQNTISLNYVCKMWWDIFPRHGLGFKDDTMKLIDQTVLLLLEEILQLNNLACKYSALHGLGHWHVSYPDEIEDIINRNIIKIPHDLHSYALRCRSGLVQ